MMNLKQPLFTLLLAMAAGLAGAATPQGELEQVLHAIPDPQHGEALFQVCMQCHGARGGGLPSGWVPEIAGQHPHVIAKELVDYRHQLRWDDRMEKVAGRHLLETPQDIADVTAYVGALRPSLQSAVGDGQSLERGRELYAKRCNTCHGRDGQGSNAQRVPRVAGQQYGYLLRQMHDTVDGRRPNMSAMHVGLLKPLDMGELVGVADYMSRMPQGQPPHDPRTAALAPEAFAHP
jgi:cytochrome c553